MWSLTSQRAKRISGPKKFRLSAKKDFFFNTICHHRKSVDLSITSSARSFSTKHLGHEQKASAVLVIV
jgi:hypothetical protein